MSQLVENKDDIPEAENISIMITFIPPIRKETIYAKIHQSNIAEYQSCQRTSSYEDNSIRLNKGYFLLAIIPISVCLDEATLYMLMKFDAEDYCESSGVPYVLFQKIILSVFTQIREPLLGAPWSKIYFVCSKRFYIY